MRVLKSVQERGAYAASKAVRRHGLFETNIDSSKEKYFLFYPAV
jgi:hypothetical protein